MYRDHIRETGSPYHTERESTMLHIVESAAELKPVAEDVERSILQIIREAK